MPGVLPLQIVVKKCLLHFPSIVCINLCKVLQSMNLQKFFLAARPEETFHVATQVQSIPSPVSTGQHGDSHLTQVRRAIHVVFVIQLVSKELFFQIHRIGRQLFIREVHVAGYPHTIDPADLSPGPQPVLNDRHLNRLPKGKKVTYDTAVASHIPIIIIAAFEGTNGRQMGRLESGGGPLIDAIVGDAQQADLPAAPGLCGGPFNAFVDILRLLFGPEVNTAFGVACAAGIDADAHISMRHPLFRVHSFPVHIFAGSAFQDLRVHLLNTLPEYRIAVREMDALSIGAIGHKRGILPIIIRAKNISPENNAVLHGNGNIPVNPHVVLHDALEGKLFHSLYILS